MPVLAAAGIGAAFFGLTIGSMLYPKKLPVAPNLQAELDSKSSRFEIDPDRFRGRRFFLNRFVQIDADLTRGRWKVILTRAKCPRCDRGVRSAGCSPEGDERVAIVQVGGERDWGPPRGVQGRPGLPERGQDMGLRGTPGLRVDGRHRDRGLLSRGHRDRRPKSRPAARSSRRLPAARARTAGAGSTPTISTRRRSSSVTLSVTRIAGAQASPAMPFRWRAIGDCTPPVGPPTERDDAKCRDEPPEECLSRLPADRFAIGHA